MDANPEAELYHSIMGGTQLLRWFGRVPSFHDAEVVALSLFRKGTSRLIVHGWNMTSRLNEDGQFVLEKHAVVTYLLDGVTDLQLEGFNQQNVIDGLRLSRCSGDLTGVNMEPGFELELDHCYGLSGFIRCRRVEVTFVPGSP